MRRNHTLPPPPPIEQQVESIMRLIERKNDEIERLERECEMLRSMLRRVRSEWPPAPDF